MFSPETVLKEKYEAFKTLLAQDKAAHEHLAALENLYYNHKRYDFQAVVKTYGQFSQAVLGMVDALLTMCPSRYRDLHAYFKKFDFYVQFILAPPEFECSAPFTLPFDKAAFFDEAMVGRKAFNLSHLAKTVHLPTPDGFVITTRAFNYFLAYNNLQTPINEKLATLNIGDATCLERTASEIQHLILEGVIPHEIEVAMNKAMTKLGQSRKKDITIALRSSAVKEDGIASFAGQYYTLLNVDKTDIPDSYKKIIASKYTPRALFYRINHGILDTETPMAVLVLEMIDSMASGVMYTRDIQIPKSDNLVIHSVWGQGELLVDGGVSPDEIRISRKNPGVIFQATCGKKQAQMELAPNITNNFNTGTCTIESPQHKRNELSLDDPSLLTLARWGFSLEKHFKHPQDIEWCQDTSGRLFILQSRPLHMHAMENKGNKKTEHPRETEKEAHTILCSGGKRVCPGIASGSVYRLSGVYHLEDMPQGSVLVVRHAPPRFVTAIEKMAAVVIASGSTASHFSSLTREFGVPAIVNVQHGFQHLTHGREVTVNADRGMVYDGIHSPSTTTPLEHPLANETFFKNSSFMLKLRYIIDFSAKLKLTDPESSHFTPGGCRSLHDIVRFAHETAVKEMFFTGNRRGRPTRAAKKLICPIPMLFYLLDVGQAIKTNTKHSSTISPEEITSLPMKWVLKGLLKPGIDWSEATHFDWETHDKIVMAGGIISANSPRFGSYAVASAEYVNINFRFGYHFVILDTICTDLPGDNYILFRFSGGGGEPEGRKLRATFIEGVLIRLGFTVTVQSDLVDGEFRHADLPTMEKTLDMIGRLLGTSKLMDMYLKEDQAMDFLIDEFMAGQYDFRNRA